MIYFYQNVISLNFCFSFFQVIFVLILIEILLFKLEASNNLMYLIDYLIALYLNLILFYGNINTIHDLSQIKNTFLFLK